MLETTRLKENVCVSELMSDILKSVNKLM